MNWTYEAVELDCKVFFSAIKVGETFIYEALPYLKVEEQRTINAVNLNNNTLHCFSNQKVERAKHKLVVEIIKN